MVASPLLTSLLVWTTEDWLESYCKLQSLNSTELWANLACAGLAADQRAFASLYKLLRFSPRPSSDLCCCRSFQLSSSLMRRKERYCECAWFKKKASSSLILPTSLMKGPPSTGSLAAASWRALSQASSSSMDPTHTTVMRYALFFYSPIDLSLCLEHVFCRSGSHSQIG